MTNTPKIRSQKSRTREYRSTNGGQRIVTPGKLGSSKLQSEAKSVVQVHTPLQALAGAPNSWRRASQSCMGLRRDACANQSPRNARKGVMLRLQAYHSARMVRSLGIGLVKPCSIGAIMQEMSLVEEINNCCIPYIGQITPQLQFPPSSVRQCGESFETPPTWCGGARRSCFSAFDIFLRSSCSPTVCRPSMGAAQFELELPPWAIANS